MSIGEVATYEYSRLRTIKLVFASVLALLIAVGGLPIYFTHADPVTFVGIAWFVATDLVGFAIGVDCAVGRRARNCTVVFARVRYVLTRPL